MNTPSQIVFLVLENVGCLVSAERPRSLSLGFMREKQGVNESLCLAWLVESNYHVSIDCKDQNSDSLERPELKTLSSSTWKGGGGRSGCFFPLWVKLCNGQRRETFSVEGLRPGGGGRTGLAYSCAFNSILTHRNQQVKLLVAKSKCVALLV